MTKNKNINVKSISGFSEYLPDDQVLFDKLKTLFADFCKLHGFIPLDTPVIERSEVLFAKEGGETSKQVFFVKNKNSIDNDEFALRFDLTVPFARYVANNFSNLTFPFKRYAIAKVYRGERAQKGRSREFYQSDFDVVSSDLDISIDVMYTCMISEILNKFIKILNITDSIDTSFNVHISNRKILNGVLNYMNISDIDKVSVLRIIDKYRKVTEENIVKMLLDTTNLTNEQITYILNIIKLSGDNKSIIDDLKKLPFAENSIFLDGVNELEYFVNLDKRFNIKIDLSITRGLDYYTGIVVETFFTKYKDFGSIFSGGRYDNLIADFANQKLEGFGLSFGLSRFFDLVLSWKENNYFDIKEIISDGVLFAYTKYYHPLDLYDYFIKNNLRSDISFFKDISKHYRYAEKNNFKYIIIIDSENQGGLFKVKNLLNKNSITASLIEIKDFILNGN